MAKQAINFSPTVLDLSLYAGDGVSFRLVVTTPTDEIVNLTGTMLAQIRDKRDSVTEKATFDIDLTDAADGVTILQLTGDQTQTLCTAGKAYSGVWDLEWTATDEEPVTIVQGKVECAPDVSH